MALTNKQRVFIAEYVRDFNATRAAIAAGYSERTARSIGQENLTKPDIKEEVDLIIAERCMGPDETLIRLGEQARAAYSEYMTTEGGIDLERMIGDGKGHLIKKLKPTLYGLEVEFYDAQSALVQIGRHHKLFVDKTELTGKDGQDLIPIAVVQPGYLDKLK